MNRLKLSYEDIVNVRFYTGWNICNFSCEYCDDNHSKINPLWNVDNYNKIISNLKKLPCKINIRLGVEGEFFLSDELIYGASELSNAENVVSVNLITNLSLSIDEYHRKLRSFDMRKVAIVATLHPTQVKDQNDWMATAKYMNDNCDFFVCLVAYPPIVSRLSELKLHLEKTGFSVFIHSFIGIYNDKRYPQSYTNEERELFRKLFYSRHDYEFFVALKKPGLCNAGFKSFYVSMDGTVYSCGMGKPSMTRLGNLAESTRIDLFDCPRPCINETCLCHTENNNTVCFSQYYVRKGINQQNYSYRYKDLAEISPEFDEWKILY